LRPIIVPILLIIAVLGLTSCDVDKEKAIFMAPGSYGDVAVVVSHASMAGNLGGFKSAFNEELTFILARENRFKIDVFTPDKWDLCKGYKNIIFVWRVGDGGPVEKMLDERLSKAGRSRVQTGSGTILQMEEPFASYQIGVIVAATDRNSLFSYLKNQAPELRERFERESSLRIMRRYRHDGINSALMQDLWRRHRFFIEIPTVFKLNQDSPDGYPAVELMQTAPSRGLTIGWTQSSDPELLMSQHFLLLELRKELGLKMHHEDINPQSLVWKTDTLGDLSAVRLEGAWTSRSFEGGGAFWSWFVADPASNRVFCLDGLVYAPGSDKMDYFRRLRTIAQTFSLERPQP